MQAPDLEKMIEDYMNYRSNPPIPTFTRIETLNLVRKAIRESIPVILEYISNNVLVCETDDAGVKCSGSKKEILADNYVSVDKKSITSQEQELIKLLNL